MSSFHLGSLESREPSLPFCAMSPALGSEDICQVNERMDLEGSIEGWLLAVFFVLVTLEHEGSFFYNAHF
jgi:hypothetical protein